MGDDPRGVPVSRRGLLSAVVATGSVGAVTGLGTGAVLSDVEPFAENQFVAGELDLAVRWERTGGGGGTSGGTVSLDVAGLKPGESGASTIVIDLPQDGDTNNPAYVWLRGRCPDPSGALAAELRVALYYAAPDGSRATDGSGDELVPIVEGQLCDAAEAVRNGVPIDAGTDPDPVVEPGDQICLDTVEGDPVRLRFEWELEETYEAGSGVSTSITFDFAARQCRHRDGTVNPFPKVEPCACASGHGISYVEIYGCMGASPGCDGTLLGKIELEEGYCGEAGIGENLIQPENNYALHPDGDDCDEDTGYVVRVTDTRTKTEAGSTETTAVELELFERSSDETLAPVDLGGVVVCSASYTVTYDADALAPRSNSTEGPVEGILYRPGNGEDNPVVSGRCGNRGPPPGRGPPSMEDTLPRGGS
jgi:hypothetical protein